MVVEFSQARADRYERAMTAAPQARAAELEKLQALLRRLEVAGCRKIVELGAGHGFATMALMDFLAPDGVVVAIDNSSHMAARIPQHRKIRPLVAELSELEVDTGTVDLAVSLATFHHITHKTLVLREMRRIVRTGGYIVIADVNHGTPVQEFFDHVVRKYCTEGHDWDFLDHSWIEVIARRAGLEHVCSSVESTPWYFASEETMLQYVGNLTSLELQAADLKPFIHEWLRPQTEADGRSVILPWSLGFHALRAVRREA
jgi:ubiquinone/menaquinone biosynthesis C-methylase UbiE